MEHMSENWEWILFCCVHEYFHYDYIHIVAYRTIVRRVGNNKKIDDGDSHIYYMYICTNIWKRVLSKVAGLQFENKKMSGENDVVQKLLC